VRVHEERGMREKKVGVREAMHAYMVGRKRMGMRVFSTSNSCISVARKRKNCAGENYADERASKQIWTVSERALVSYQSRR
jgi:hypothetical protein